MRLLVVLALHPNREHVPEILDAVDQLLAETSDNMYSSGDIGFTATSYELEGTEIQFDDLIVK